MAKLIKATAWRELERPYTRKSKYKEQNFVRSVPNSEIVTFVMGEKSDDQTHKVRLISKQGLQIRHNAIEAGRNSANSVLQKRIPERYFFQVRMYPHHALRNNPLAAGAGADRMSTGMSHSFGKVISIAAQVKEGKTILEVRVDEDDVGVAKEALRRAKCKFPGSYRIKTDKLEE